MLKQFDDMPTDARLWIYQANRLLTSEETLAADTALQNFAGQWQSHGKSVVGWAGIKENLFAVFLVDEKLSGVSGCSIDSSVAQLRQLGDQFKIDWFDRLTLAVDTDNGPMLVSRNDFAARLADGSLNQSSLVYNNLLNSLGELQEKWKIPFAESWAANMV